jgi:hypothetical protein
MINLRDGNLDTDTALIYDSVHLFALALHELSGIQVKPHFDGKCRLNFPPN